MVAMRVAVAGCACLIVGLGFHGEVDALIAPTGRLCFDVPGSPGDAVIVNLTPVEASGSGFGVLVSSDVVASPLASNVNFGPGSVDPNVAVVPVGADGKVCFQNAALAEVELVADVLGTVDSASFSPADSGGAPRRALDTRVGLGGSRLAPSGRLCFAVSGSPGDAAIVNLTPVEAQSRGFGVLVSSEVAAPPLASNVNFGPGSVDPNVAVVPIGADGTVCFQNSALAGVDLVADVLGTIDAASFTPARAGGAPRRAVDTRVDVGGSRLVPSGRLCFGVSGSPGDAAVVNLTPVGAAAAGHGRLVSSDLDKVTGGSTSNVNFGPGTVDPNVAVATIGADGTVCFVNSFHGSVDLVADHLGTIAKAVYSPARLDGSPDRVVDTRVELGTESIVTLVSSTGADAIGVDQISIMCGTYIAGFAAQLPYYFIPVDVTVSGLAPDPSPDDEVTSGSRIDAELRMASLIASEPTRSVLADASGVAKLAPFPSTNFYSRAKGSITITHTVPGASQASGTTTFAFDVPCPPRTF